MGLNDALNKRITGQEHVVPVPVKTDDFLILATETPVETTPSPDSIEGQISMEMPLRDLRPGEVGTKAEPAYPDVPYSVEALKELLIRVRKGSDFLLANLDNQSGMDALGLFIDVMDSTGAMITAHMAAGILNKD